MPELDENLSERELDVLNCVVQGASNREIALELSISPNTVKVHLRNIFAKLGVASRTEATTVALQLGLVSIPGMETTADKELPPPEPIAEFPPLIAESPPPAEEDSPPLTESPEQPEPLAETAAPRRFSWGWAGLAALLLLLLSLAAASLWPRPVPASEMAESPTPMPVTAIEGSNWFDHGPAPTPRAGMATAVVGLDLYLIGGETAAGEIVNQVAVYQTAARQWGTAAPKPTAVTDATAAVLFGE